MKMLVALVRSGQFEGPEEERLEILKIAAELGADYIDVEFQVVRDFLRSALPPSPLHPSLFI